MTTYRTVTTYRTESDDFPAHPIVLCGRCEIHAGFWELDRPRCPACWTLDRAEAGQKP